MNPTCGSFTSPDGFELKFLYRQRRWIFWPEKIYGFHLDRESPMTYVRTRDGVVVERIRPAQDFLTDLGTTPPPMHCMRRWRPDFLKRSCLFHDSAFSTHGAYYSVNPAQEDSEYEFRSVSFNQANDYLLEMGMVEGFTFRKLPWDEAVKQAVEMHWAVQSFGRKW